MARRILSFGRRPRLAPDQPTARDGGRHSALQCERRPNASIECWPSSAGGDNRPWPKAEAPSPARRRTSFVGPLDTPAQRQRPPSIARRTAWVVREERNAGGRTPPSSTPVRTDSTFVSNSWLPDLGSNQGPADEQTTADLHIFRYLGQIPFRNFHELRRVSAPKAPIAGVLAERECLRQERSADSLATPTPLLHFQRTA